MYIIWYQAKDSSAEFTFYPLQLVTGPVHPCVTSTPQRAYNPAAILAHIIYRTHCHICPTRYSFAPESSEACEGKVSCPRTQQRNIVPMLRGENMIISLKILNQAGFETARQAAYICQCRRQRQWQSSCATSLSKHRYHKGLPNQQEWCVFLELGDWKWQPNGIRLTYSYIILHIEQAAWVI